MIMRLAQLLPVFVIWPSLAFSQGFGPQRVITTEAFGARSVYATDIDGDGDADVLSASAIHIAWYENYGGGWFGPQQLIDTGVDDGTSV
ncbi:MAG: VCBS repeat-containing protein, partial [Planctomycetota bacterium]|nr:VCBS repeat-containing protein [Planctomycetota bacterium]